MKLTCEKLLFGGFGLVRTEEQGVVFVEGLLPGETGEVTESGKKGGIPFYTTTKVLEISPHRRESLCEYFGVCGGCNWLHIAYEEQVVIKKAIFMETLTRMGHLKDLPEPELFTGPEMGYRRRAQLNVNSKDKTLGFYKRGSNDIVAIKRCPLLTDKLNSIIEEKEAIFRNFSKIKSIKVLEADDVVLSSPLVSNLTKQYGTLLVGDTAFQLEGNSFFQSNQFLTEKLSDWCDVDLSGKHLLDLFGGVGLFAVRHGKNFEAVTLVEQSKVMTEKAQFSMKSNGIKNGKTYAMTAERFFAQAKSGTYDTIIVDPPRTGLSREVRKGIAALVPETILYISCDPTTQARDLEVLVNKKRYRIVKMALFDLYPNTHHMETGVLLKRA